MRIIISSILIALTFSAFCCKQPDNSTKRNLTTSDKTNSVDSNNLSGSKIYSHLTPNQFLNQLRDIKRVTNGLNIAVYTESPANWIKNSDIDTLIHRVFDTTKVPCIVNPYSSYLPTNSHSCIGREAQNMITSYINKKGYLNFLYSCGSVDSLNGNRLIDWYHKK